MLLLLRKATNEEKTNATLQALLSRIGYTTEGAFFISMQLSTDAVTVSALKKICTNKTVEATQHPNTHINMRCVCPG